MACKDLRSMDLIGRNDVFVEIQCGDRAAIRTRVLQNAGANVVFDPVEVFQLYEECV